MPVNSRAYLAFLPAVALAFHICPARHRWAVLLAASAAFYAAFFPPYLGLLLALVAADYLLALWIEGLEGRRRDWVFGASLALNLAPIFLFKNSSLLQPLGLSFITLQSASYLIEVYRGLLPAERHPGIYALYVMFFPQVTAGPIGRPRALLPQLRQPPSCDAGTFVEGLELVLWGFFKKLVIADRLVPNADWVFGAEHAYAGAPTLLALYVFAVQLYCDFSGYSDIAMGSARMLGCRLTSNFNRPYYAESIADFWRRWHVSLTSWLRDYVYVPISTDLRRGRIAANILAVFLLSGLWHGVEGRFLAWGAFLGTLTAASFLTRDLRARWNAALGLDRAPRLRRGLRIVLTFHMVTLSWLFFRAKSLEAAWYSLTHLFAGWPAAVGIGNLGLLPADWAIAAAAVVFMELVQWRGEPSERGNVASGWSLPARWGFYYAAIFGIITVGKFDELQFIYRRF